MQHIVEYTSGPLLCQSEQTLQTAVVPSPVMLELFHDMLPCSDAMTGPRRQARDWNCCRVVLSPMKIRRCPLTHSLNAAASHGRSLQLWGVNTCACTGIVQCAVLQLKPSKAVYSSETWQVSDVAKGDAMRHMLAAAPTWRYSARALALTTADTSKSALRQLFS